MSDAVGRQRHSSSDDGAASIELVLFDIGGVLGSNGWDREQRAAAVKRFGLEEEDFQYRHEETVGAFESGDITLDDLKRAAQNHNLEVEQTADNIHDSAKQLKEAGKIS